MTTKILCVADGTVTRKMMEDMRALEQLGAEVTIVEDTDMATIADVTDRMGLIERKGIDAASPAASSGASRCPSCPC